VVQEFKSSKIPYIEPLFSKAPLVARFKVGGLKALAKIVKRENY